MIEERINGAGAVVVLWSARSREVAMGPGRGRYGARRADLVQATLDGTIPPMPFNQIQCADLSVGRAADDRRLAQAGASVRAGRIAGRSAERSRADPTREVSICVLPFQNMSGDRRAGIFQRRDQRGHHHRSVEGLRARGDRAQYRLHLQGPVGERVRGREETRRHATCSKAACARSATGCGSPPS